MARTATRTKSVSKTKMAVATGALLVAGGAAYGFGVMPGSIGYEKMSVQCHNGSEAQVRSGAFAQLLSYQSEIQPRKTNTALEANCTPSRAMKDFAAQFCSWTDIDSGHDGKPGVNSYKISKRCKITSQNWYARRSQGSRR